MSFMLTPTQPYIVGGEAVRELTSVECKIAEGEALLVLLSFVG